MKTYILMALAAMNLVACSTPAYKTTNVEGTPISTKVTGKVQSVICLFPLHVRVAPYGDDQSLDHLASAMTDAFHTDKGCAPITDDTQPMYWISRVYDGKYGDFQPIEHHLTTGQLITNVVSVAASIAVGHAVGGLNTNSAQDMLLNSNPGALQNVLNTHVDVPKRDLTREMLPPADAGDNLDIIEFCYQKTVSCAYVASAGRVNVSDLDNAALQRLKEMIK